MATVVTLTIADADAPRCVNTAIAPNQWAAGALPPFFPPTGASNAALLKAWLSNLVQQAVLAHEGDANQAHVPAIT